MRAIEISSFGTATLGSVIDALSFADPDATVMFDFCGVWPKGIASYRGYYSHLAMGWTGELEREEQSPTAKDVLALLESAVDAGFEGYKGGLYHMNRATPLWVDNVGDATGTGIVGVQFLGTSCVMLKTAKVE